ncbi:MAG TPA: hypothetical protein VEB61_07945 [Candidatus Binatia bacterium]|nr:hypothetical protein [Candidatus Binatia bacterium]
MSSPRKPQRMTKKQFVKVVTRGTLSADQAIGKMVDELQSYERKCGMRSEIFYALIPGTQAEDQPDFLNWAICYRSYFRALQSKFPFKELSRYAV